MSDGANCRPAETSARNRISLLACVKSVVVSESDAHLAATNFLESCGAIRITAGIYATLPEMQELPKELQSAFVEIVLHARI